MAFFSDGNNEYFSLNLKPAEDKQSYVFALNKWQIYISGRFTNYSFLISICIFVLVVSLIAIEVFDLNKLYLTESNQEFLVLALAGLAGLIAISEVVFFMWVRGCQDSLLTGTDRKNLTGIFILKTRSWKAYCIFLLNMTVPLISLAALPGGVSRVITENSNHGNIFLFFFIQLMMLFLVLTIFLIKRIAVLWQ
ncbi:hypothetical protein [Undibacterium griseum]|uniref:RDD family protein n=1 Tax=Undibacterium griseum TaxID=2762295 RepID=A0ABR6YK87_9BURK|nr:hypothetical protein [Undibacterium griseum]MBC3884229.1 hypothetical protein [Undibacterium griseum]